MPSFYALANPIVGDPTLKAETSQSVEAGVSREFQLIPLELQLNAFHTSYGNLIDFLPGPVPKLVNLSQVTVHGGEISITLNPRGRWVVASYLSDTVTEDEATGSSLRDIPRWAAGGNMLWRPNDTLEVNMKLFYVGSYVDNSVPTGDVQLGGYQRLDVSLTKRVQSNARLVSFH